MWKACIWTRKGLWKLSIIFATSALFKSFPQFFLNEIGQPAQRLTRSQNRAEPELPRKSSAIARCPVSSDSSSKHTNPVNQHFSTLRTIGAGTGFVMNITGVHMPNAILLASGARVRVRAGVGEGRWPIGMKRGKMQPHPPQVRDDPLSFFQFGFESFSRNQQGGDFKPNHGFMFKILQCCQNRSQRTPTFPVKFLGKRFQIHVGGVHVVKNSCAASGWMYPAVRRRNKTSSFAAWAMSAAYSEKTGSLIIGNTAASQNLGLFR